jgi:hypothetical protein
MLQMWAWASSPVHPHDSESTGVDARAYMDLGLF